MEQRLMERVENKLQGVVELLAPPTQTAAAQHPPGAAPLPAHSAGDLRRVVAMMTRLEASSATKVSVPVMSRPMAQPSASFGSQRCMLRLNMVALAQRSQA
jgi:hypothetical protein